MKIWQRYSTRKPFWYFLITVTSVALCDFYFESVLFQSSISKNMEGSILFHMDTRVVIHRVVQIRYTYCTSAVLTCIYHSQVFWWKLCHSFIFKFASKKFSCRQIFLSKDYIVCFLSNEICNIYSTQIIIAGLSTHPICTLEGVVKGHFALQPSQKPQSPKYETVYSLMNM